MSSADLLHGNKVVEGDAREVLRGLPDSCLDCTITSPPYFGLREYTGDEREIGLEETLPGYIQSLCDVFNLVGQKTKITGSLWVNLGETYKDGQALTVTWQFMMQMVHVYGWILKNVVVWAKPDAMSESVNNRFSQKWEPFFWFTKRNAGYYFNEDAAKIPVKASTIQRMEHKFYANKGTDVSRMRGMLGDQSEKVDQYLERGVNAGDFWVIPTNKERVQHAAPYPVELVVRPIVATCPEKGYLFDPFAGSGTTGVGAARVGGGRNFLGTDINALSVAEANERIERDALQGELF